MQDILRHKPYIIAEVNSSHFGNIDTALLMIKTLKDIGANCVKFQSFSVESLYSQSYYLKNPIQKRIIDKFSIKKDDFIRLRKYAEELDIDFSSTPYSKEEVDFLLTLQVPFIKIASQEIDNLDFLEYIAKSGANIIISSGMASVEEIQTALDTILQHNKNIILLHCTSIYPTPNNLANLNNITMLKERFNINIGYSDHTQGYKAASLATALGACVIEKHFSLDNTKMGMDNNMAANADDFKDMILQIKHTIKILGSKERILSDEELVYKQKMQRNIVANKNLNKGDTISKDDLDFKRAGFGLSIKEKDKLIGKTLKNDIQKDFVITLEDLQ